MLDLKIPVKVTMTGGTFLSPGMEVPDTMDVSMEQSEKILFTWNSMFGNRHYGEGDDLLLGDKGAIARDEDEHVRYLPEGKESAGARVRESAGSAAKSPDIVGGSDLTDLHMQNFFDCVRSRKEPNCPLELGFRSAIACQMAIASYRQGRVVRWDPRTEDIV